MKRLLIALITAALMATVPTLVSAVDDPLEWIHITTDVGATLDIFYIAKPGILPPAVYIVGGGSMPETIHITTTAGGADLTTVHRGEPGAMGAPPAVYLNGVNLNGG